MFQSKQLMALAALSLTGCVFGGFEESPGFIQESDAGATYDASDPVDVGPDLPNGEPSFEIASSEPFGAPAAGSRVGFGGIAEGFAAVELIAPGRARAHTINYDGSTSIAVTNDIIDMVPGGIEAIATTFDGSVDPTGFFYTVSVFPSERAVTRCTFATQMCSDVFVSGNDRGNDLGFAASPQSADVAYLTNEDGVGLVVGGVSRNPFGASASSQLLEGVNTTGLAIAAGDGLSQLAWIDTDNSVYQAARWRVGSFASEPSDCGTVQGGVAAIAPAGTGGTVIFLQNGDFRRSNCSADGSSTIDRGQEAAVIAFGISNTGTTEEIIAWVTSENILYAARLELGGFRLSDITAVATVGDVDGIRVAIADDTGAAGILTWGERLQTFVLAPAS